MPLIRKDSASAAAVPKGAPSLTAASAEERFAAARTLVGQPEATARLGAALAAESDSRARGAILTGLAKIGTRESAAHITPLIRSDDADVRTAALDALRLMPDAVATHLGGLLSDNDADVRLLACELARHLTTPVATALISELLDHEAEPNVCAAALDVLAEVGGPEALPALQRLQMRFADEPFLSFAIRVAMDRIGAKPGG